MSWSGWNSRPAAPPRPDRGDAGLFRETPHHGGLERPIESHINPGRQDLNPDKPLAYGQSITDACLGWDDTAPLLRELAQAVRVRRVAAPADEE